MDSPTVWWILAGALVAAELVSGTFYLLMLSLGAAAAALAAHMGMPPEAHWATFAAVGGGAVLVLYLIRRRRKPTAEDERHDHLDLGAMVHVTKWSPEGQTRVQYRGAEWSARHAHGGAPRIGPHRIAGQDGNELLLDPLPSAEPQVPVVRDDQTASNL